jgi:hypothetical protein
MITRRFLEIIKQHIAILIFIVIYLSVALLTHKDFGLTWDEPVNYTQGVVSYEHIFCKKVNRPWAFNKTNGWIDITDSTSFRYFDRLMNAEHDQLYYYLHYSGFYPMILFMLNTNKSIDLYHLLNMLCALGVFLAVYGIFYKQYRDQRIAILGPLFLFLTPRFTGDIPANPKDVPFAVMYFVSCATLYAFASSTKVLTRILFLGILIGITQNIRSAGVTLYGIVILYDTYVYYQDKRLNTSAAPSWTAFVVREIQIISLIGIVALCFSFLTWPYLAANLIPNLKEVFAIQRGYTWNETVLYNGSYIEGTRLPGSYFTTWFAICTPLMVLVPAIISPFCIRKCFQHRLFVLFLMIIALNTTAYLIVRPVVYDGVRLFLFLVPPLASIAALSVIEFFRTNKNRLLKGIIGILIIIDAGFVVKEMLVLHPYQYIYFNELVGGLEGAYKHYDTEYWGASYNEAINWFKENIAVDKKKLYNVHIDGIKYYVIYQAWNIKKVPFEEADYCFWLNRRMKEEPKKEDVLHVVTRKGIPLAFVTKKTKPGG